MLPVEVIVIEVVIIASVAVQRRGNQGKKIMEIIKRRHDDPKRLNPGFLYPEEYEYKRIRRFREGLVQKLNNLWKNQKKFKEAVDIIEQAKKDNPNNLPF